MRTMGTNDTYYEHQPVLLQESVDYLITDPGGIYIDATLGGGGHSRALLSQLHDDAQIIGIDQDDEALRAAGNRLGDDPRFSTLKGNFGYLTRLLSPELHGEVSGILLDLGVSTHQITEAGRGFTFREEGDRKSTRLNSSHVAISYAVFCLKKKKAKQNRHRQHKRRCDTTNLHN